MATHVMVDLETWSTSGNALIVSIGAVKFDSEKVLERFEVGVNPADAMRYDLHMDADTILWWMGEERDAARKAWLNLPKVDLFAALDGFAMWVRETPADAIGSIWGNGATFDNVILGNAFERLAIDYPVRYSKNECYRTIKNRFPDVVFERVGLHHSPADDAQSQAQHLIEIAKAHGIKL